MELRKTIEAQLNTLAISKKIHLIYIPPTIILALFIIAAITGSIKQIRQANAINDTVQLGLILDGVAHNHAVERGLSAGFLGSKGTKGKDAVATQRKKADAATQVFLQYIANHKDKYPKEIQLSLTSLKEQLHRVATLRSQIDVLDTSGNPFLTYSTVNKSSLDILASLSSLIADAEVITLIQRFNAILWMKERAGQERGALNGVFASGVFSVEKISAINVYYTDQQTRMESAQRNMPAKLFQSFANALDDDSGKSVQAYRNIFFEAVNRGEFKVTADSAAWFAAATARIKNIKQASDATALTINDTANSTLIHAWTTLLLTLLLTALGGAAMHWFSTLLIQHFTSSISHLTNGLNRVSKNKDFGQRLQNHSQDELGEATSAFNNLMSQLQSAIGDVNVVMTAIARGDFSARAKEHIEGDLKTLTTSVNNSAEKVQITMTALSNVMNALERGDFSARMSQDVEGEFKHKVDNAMAATELAINEVSEVMTNMREGNFSHRISVSLNGSLNTLKDSVNISVANIESALSDISHAVVQQKNGNFNWRINGTYKGDLLVLKDTINDSMNSIDIAIQGIARVFEHVRHGDFKERITSDMSGDLDTMKTNINISINELEQAVTEISNAAKAQREGNLNIEITGDYQGDLKILKTALNDTGLTLNSVFSQITTTMESLKNGEFSQRINYTMGGCFEALKENINDSLDSLQTAVNDITATALAQSEGELTKRMSTEHKGELHNISNAINSTMETLANIVREVQASSDQTITMSQEQSIASMDMSSRTESQAAALEEIASNMDSIRAKVTSTGNDCANMTGMIEEINKVTQNSVKTVNKTVSSMKEMLSSSQEIAKITNLIDEIAFQTNLLALNAAVEAARAGEKGRGFAVVASEVRNLAQRSADAAKNIKELINDNLNKVSDSFTLSQQSDQDLNTIATKVVQSLKLMNNVSLAATEQSKGINEVNTAITSLDTMTQENAAMVEETTAAAKSVEEQITNVNNMLRFFKLH